MYLLFSIYRVVSLVLRDNIRISTHLHTSGAVQWTENTALRICSGECATVYFRQWEHRWRKSKIIINNNIQALPFLLFLSLQKANRIKRRKKRKRVPVNQRCTCAHLGGLYSCGAVVQFIILINIFFFTLYFAFVVYFCHCIS